MSKCCASPCPCSQEPKLNRPLQRRPQSFQSQRTGSSGSQVLAHIVEGGLEGPFFCQKRGCQATFSRFAILTTISYTISLRIQVSMCASICVVKRKLTPSPSRSTKCSLVTWDPHTNLDPLVVETQYACWISHTLCQQQHFGSRTIWQWMQSLRLQRKTQSLWTDPPGS